MLLFFFFLNCLPKERQWIGVVKIIFEAGLWLAETNSQMWFCFVFLLSTSVDVRMAHSENQFHFRIPGNVPK